MQTLHLVGFVSELRSIFPSTVRDSNHKPLELIGSADVRDGIRTLDHFESRWLRMRISSAAHSVRLSNWQ